MKKIIILALGVLFLGCAKDLNTTNPYKVQGESIEPEQLIDMVRGMHYTMATHYAYEGQMYFGQKSFDYLFGLKGNDMSMAIINQFRYADYNFTNRYENDMTTNQWWKYYWKFVSSSNDMLVRIKDAENDDNPQGLKDELLQHKATAMAFRGYAYFYLANLYQFAYSDATKDKLCVPLVTEESESKIQPRATLQAIYDQIIGDLTTAQDIFTGLNLVKGASTEMDATVCAAYLWRAYLALGEYQKAIDQADLVIKNYKPLVGRDALWHGLNEVGRDNVILGYEHSDYSKMYYASWFSQMDTYGAGYGSMWGVKPASSKLVDRISDTDDRLFWWSTPRSSRLLGEGDGQTAMIRDTKYSCAQLSGYMKDGYVNQKFIGAGRAAILADAKGVGVSGGWTGDYIYLRSEEAYYVKAEAQAQLDNLTGAIKTLEDFVKTRDAAYVCLVSAKADVIEEIIFHKRVELWGEGVEYLDNRRLNIPIDRTDSNHHLKIKKEQSEFDMILQLPYDEITNNKLIGQENQNK